MIIKVKVKSNSSKDLVEEISKDNGYLVYVKAFPENNKANLSVIKLLSKYFKTQDSNIKIIKGKTSRNKLIELKE
ncbi:MAG TPA: DUF167 domain-containing protein [Candidatus Nanoarchaeia archaeon]|nr:DUF167 domain-containing protein [Candidatus Nanoarchaeia archaeon]